MPAPGHCYNCDVPSHVKTQHGVPLCKRCLDELDSGEGPGEPATLPPPANVACSTATWHGGPAPHSAACKCTRCSP